MFTRTFLSVVALCLINTGIGALTLPIIDNSDVVGELQTVIAKKGETIFDIARRFDVGTYAMIEANPKINHKKLTVGQKLIVPTEFILPPTRDGIVINLAELRVYYFHPDTKQVSTFPVGLGKIGWRTPIGETTIVKKREHPTWTPPDSIRAEAEARGKHLPDVVPAGPHNPLGDYAMNLGWHGFLMHGTNSPESVGLRSSHGCIRLYPEDIKQLFNLTELDTKVTVIHMPYKIGMENGELYLEAHDPLPDTYYGYDGLSEDEVVAKIVEMASERHLGSIDINLANAEVKQSLGYPVKLRLY
jgi:L,D-transpeptidase ErfK/SrfK